MLQQHSITDFISHQHNNNSTKQINHHMPHESFSNSIPFQPTKTNLISKQSNHEPILHKQDFNSIQTSNNLISDFTSQTHPINTTNHQHIYMPRIESSRHGQLKKVKTITNQKKTKNIYEKIRKLLLN